MGDQGQERLQQAEGQQPGEEEDEERARDGSRRRVRLHRIVQGQVHDADSVGPISADCGTFAGGAVSIKVDDGPRPFDDAKGAVGDVGPAEACVYPTIQSDAAPARAVVASVALAALMVALM